MDIEGISEAARLEPGDMLVLVTKQPMKIDRMEAIQNSWNNRFGDRFHMAIIDGSGFEVRIMAAPK